MLYTLRWYKASNRLFKGPTNLCLIQVLVQLIPKGVVWVLYVGSVVSTAKKSTRLPKTVEVWHLVAYHDTPLGGPTR